MIANSINEIISNTTYSYDNNGIITKKITKITNSDKSDFTKFKYFYEDGILFKVEKNNELFTEIDNHCKYYYDKDVLSKVLFRDKNNNVVRKELYRDGKIDEVDKFSYDSKGRQVKEEVYDFKSKELKYSKSIEYDDNGSLIRHYKSGKKIAKSICLQTKKIYKQIDFTYSVKIKTLLNAFGEYLNTITSFVKKDSEGKVVETFNGDKNIHSFYEYDDRGRLLSVYINSNENSVISVKYNRNSRISKITKSSESNGEEKNSLVYSVKYDENGNKIKEKRVYSLVSK